MSLFVSLRPRPLKVPSSSSGTGPTSGRRGAVIMNEMKLLLGEETVIATVGAPGSTWPVVRLKGQPKSIHVRLGAGREATVAGEGVSVKSLTGIGHHTRQVAVMRVPAAWF